MAVYTDVSDEELESFIRSYDIGAVTSFKGIAEGVENSNYLVHTETGPYILTLYEKRVSLGDLPYFLALMEHLASRGITCPLPVHDREGRNLKELAGRPAALITFLEGLCVRRPDIEHCAGLGRALAGFHVASADFPLHRANSLSLPGWRTLFGEIGKGADEVDLYSVALQSGETLDASIHAQQAGSGLTGLLRAFNANGTPLSMPTCSPTTCSYSATRFRG